MNRIVRTVRRLDPRRSQAFSILVPNIEITWADIMHDLDPNWTGGNWATETEGGVTR